MLKALAAFSALILFSFSSGAQTPKDHVLFVSQAAGTPELTPGDTAQAHELRNQFAEILGPSFSANFQATNINIKSFKDLAAEIDRKVPATDRINAIVFIGHGTPTTFLLTADQSYSGAEIAAHTWTALKNRATSSRLLVYFSACSNGETSRTRNLQTEFLETLGGLDTVQRWSEVHAIAHEDFSTLYPQTMLPRYGKFQHVFYNSGVARVLYKFDLMIQNLAGYTALGFRSAVKGLALGVAVGVLANGVGDAGFTIETLRAQIASIGISVILGDLLMMILDFQRFAWVNVKTFKDGAVKKGAVSTARSALEALLLHARPTAMRCELVFN